jgi:hypothetical protein
VLIIDHRVNSLKELEKVPVNRGVEIDIRDYDGDLILGHDPLTGGQKLSQWLKNYKHAFCIFNVKCDGLESAIETLAQQAGVKNYFFLDCANPTLVSLARRGQKKVAVRFSEYEPLEAALAFKGLIDWVWVDCFTRLPLNQQNYKILKQHFKICLVSPELQKHSRETIVEYKNILKKMPLDAVCTDFPEDWQ